MSVSGEYEYKHSASETEARDMHPQAQNYDFLENCNSYDFHSYEEFSQNKIAWVISWGK
jgi:hypothetical protein